MPTIRSIPRTLLAVLALALLAAACSDAGADEDGQPAVVIDGDPAEPADDADSDGGADDGDAATAATATDEEAALAFAACMRDQGLDFPDPTINADGSVDFFGGGGPPQGDGAQQEGLPEALEVCGDLIAGASFLPGGGDLTEFEDQLLEVAQCLRDEGIDVDDPDLSEGFGPGAGGGDGGGGPFGADFDPNDPAVQAAIEACQDIFTGGFGGGGGRGNG